MQQKAAYVSFLPGFVIILAARFRSRSARVISPVNTNKL